MCRIEKESGVEEKKKWIEWEEQYARGGDARLNSSKEIFKKKFFLFWDA